MRVETESLNETLIEQKRDDFLVDLVRSVSADHSPRQFIFVHQRGNHVPYERNCSHISEAVHIFETDGLPKDEARRAAYDNGLRCWDRNIARLVEPLLNRRGAVHVFITADHNELMGEDGLWGHLHPTVRTAAVPMLLLTNRPSSDLARQFTSMGPATYDLSRVVAKALGVEIKLADVPANIFYLNKTMPFGMAGYLEVEQLEPWRFRVRSFDRHGNETQPQTVALPELGIAEGSSEASSHQPRIRGRSARRAPSPDRAEGGGARARVTRDRIDNAIMVWGMLIIPGQPYIGAVGRIDRRSGLTMAVDTYLTGLTRSNAERWRMRGPMSPPAWSSPGRARARPIRLSAVLQVESERPSRSRRPRAVQGPHDDLNQRGEAVQIHVSPQLKSCDQALAELK